MFFNTVINSILWFAQAGATPGASASPAGTPASSVPPAPVTTSSPIPGVTVPPVPVAHSHTYGVLTYIFLIVYFLICAGLVIAVLLQTTKSEGLTGTLGGSTQSIFKGKMGMEEQLNRLTTYLAVGFVVASLLISFFGFR